MFVWCIFVQAEPLCDEESAEEAGSETSDDDENEVEGQGDGEESEGSGDDGASDVSHGSGIDDGEETKVKGGETVGSDDGDTWTLGADEHLDQTATEPDSEQSDSEQSVGHVDLCTPEKQPDMLWREELFTSPVFGNSGPRREEIMEMCAGLLQYCCEHEPAIAKFLSLS